MGLILDHINGVRDDNRLENLRIVCPNCAATLDTHCGRKNRLERPERQCVRCNAMFRARYPQQRYCSRACGIRYERKGKPNPALRRVERPPYDDLVREIAASGYSAVGRRYGVSRQRDPQVAAPVRARGGRQRNGRTIASGRRWVATGPDDPRAVRTSP